MGFSNDAPVSGKFINLKKGKLIAQVEGERNEFNSFTGFVNEIDIVTKNYNAKDYEAIVLHLSDPDDGKAYEMAFDISSGYANAFCCISPNIDFKLALTISGGTEKLENGNEYGKLFIAQGGNPLKWYFSKSSGHQLPEPEVKTDRNGTYKDYAARIAYFKKLITEKIRPLVLAAVKYRNAENATAEPDNKKQGFKETKKGKTSKSEDTFTPAVDDLPF